MKSPKGILIVLAVVVCSLFLAAPALASTQLNNYEKQLVSLINKERTKRGLCAAARERQARRLVPRHSAEMGELDYFGHDSQNPQGESWSSRIVRYGYSRQGYSYWKAGENIYWGAGCTRAPSCCRGPWMHSSEPPGRHPHQELPRPRGRRVQDRRRLPGRRRRRLGVHHGRGTAHAVAPEAHERAGEGARRRPFSPLRGGTRDGGGDGGSRPPAGPSGPAGRRSRMSRWTTTPA